MQSGFKLHHKLTLVFFIFAVAVSGVTTTIFYNAASKRVMNDIRQRLLDVVSVAAQTVDAERLDALADRAQEGGADYMAVKTALQKVRDAASDVYFVYTMRRGPGGAITFVVDAEENPDDIAHLGEVYDDPSELLAGVFPSLSEPVVERGFYTDQWGTWLSGYAPVLRADGTRAGVLGVDISAATVMEYRKSLLVLSAGIFALVLPLMLLAGYLLGKRLARPVTEMKAGAERFGEGDLDTRIELHRGDELGVLAETLNDMAARILRGRRRLDEMVEKYRSIFENAVEGIFQTAADGSLVAANTALIRMLGYESFEDVVANVTDIRTQVYANPEDRDAMVELVRETGSVREFKTRYRRKDGSLVWVEMSARAIQGAGGAVLEGMVQDITERIERESAERERQAAEAASQAKSEFLANMSHEIRTPLNAVMGMADLLRRTELAPKQQEYLRKIKVASQSLLAVINDILDFSKIEAGRLELEKTNFSLYETMANLSEMFAQSAHDKDIELAVSIDPEVPMALVGDPVRLGQVLINLTGNALKFTAEGEVVVGVRRAEGLEPGQGRVALEFSVRDTGAGIAPGRLDAIFESFSQEDSSTTRRHGGTGLGLAICKQLSRLMGGDISVASVQGEGSTFSFTALFDLQSEDRQKRPRAPRDLRGLRVLVVDDNATSREILTLGIESFRMQAVSAASGEQALEIIKTSPEPFDLILMDWKMPGLSGMEAARKIKLELELEKLPIICMVSAYGREDLMHESEKSLLDAFLHKPVNQSLLFDTIMGLFGRQSDFASQSGALSGGAETEEAEPPERLAGARVLLVEDNAINQEVAREWLESGGMYVTTANNGRAALESLGEGEFDVVLMDIQMPEMDGLEATRRIRADSRFDTLPIIAMTAHALKGDRERGIEAGMDDYITKPIDPRKLFDALDQWVPELDPARRDEAPRPASGGEAGGGEPDFDGLDLPGVSVPTGLYRANNKPRLYLKLLRTFAADFAGAEAEMAASLGEGDLEGAGRLAHSIKGVAANIGAAPLSEAAAALEADAKDGALKKDSEHWRRFAEELGAVLGGLERHLPALEAAAAPAAEQAAEALAGPELAERLAALQAALDDDLPAAREMLVSLRPSLVPVVGGEAVDAMVSDIDEFDIDGVAQALDDAIKRIGDDT